MSVASVRVARCQDGIVSEMRYEMEVGPGQGLTVLDLLFRIQEELDPTLSFRASCRNWMCGSCGMVVNGRERLACQTKLADLAGADVHIEPMRNFPVIKDLVVDLAPFFSTFDRARASFESQSGDGLVPVLPAEREGLDEHLDCITCGLCYSACSMVATYPAYLGPAALNRAYTLQRDRRDQGFESRRDVLMGDGGVWQCHVMGDCVAVCPKGIDPRQAIQRLKLAGGGVPR